GRQAGKRDGSSSADRALLNRYCVTCHSDRLKTAGLSFEALDPAQPDADPRVWEKVVRKLRGGLMPPSGLPRPDQATLDRFLSSLEGALDVRWAASPDPGRTETLHRLNRAEYQNVVRDLLA